MFLLRTYVSILTLTYFLVTLQAQAIGILEATVVICPLLFMILDMKEELRVLRLLEARVCLFRR